MTLSEIRSSSALSNLTANELDGLGLSIEDGTFVMHKKIVSKEELAAILKENSDDDK